MRGSGYQGHEEPVEPIAAFAAELRELRTRAGSPSFRRMATTSRSISHTTLHEAATGARFPSWETTREFVRVCRGDEAEWYVRWTAAKAAMSDPVVIDPPLPSDEPGEDGNGRRPRWRALIAPGALAALAVVSTMVLVTSARSQPAPPERSPEASTGRLIGPVFPGDRSRFIIDITIPDGTWVQAGEVFEKIWEIQNVGTVVWRDRYLQRVDLPLAPGGCRSVERVPIGDTLPNERIRVSVIVTARSTSGTCMVKWKMVDGAGRLLFPSSRPVYFLVHVGVPPGTP